jgi:hypothetical protein
MQIVKRIGQPRGRADGNRKLRGSRSLTFCALYGKEEVASGEYSDLF